MEETHPTVEERKMQFVLHLRKAGVTDKDTLRAMELIPREVFVGATFQTKAGDDTALPIACGQTISAPSVVGLMTQALEVTPRCKVLEIGTGSGYQAAVLSCLARRVYTVERHAPLVATAQAAFAKLGLANVTSLVSDGTQGLPDQAPFDRIVVTAAAEDVPTPLLEHLRIGGILVIPVGATDQIQTLIKVIKTENGLEYTELQTVRFVPLLAGLAQPTGA